MVINNIELLRPLLKFESGLFYFLQVISRNKDNKNGTKQLMSYYIDSYEKLDRYLPDIIQLCDENNARAYIYLTPRSYELVNKKLLVELADRVSNNQLNFNPKKLVDSISGKYSTKDKIWIVDCDYDKGIDITDVSNLVSYINNICLPDDNDKVLKIINTPNGRHIITKPFNKSDKILSRYTTDNRVEIKTNSPTILYANVNKD